MKKAIVLILAALPMAAFAQDKMEVLGPLGPTSTFKRLVDGQNVYLVLEDKSKMTHAVVKGKLVPADAKKDLTVPIFITLEPASVMKCETGDMYYQRQKPAADPKAPGDYESWVKASGQDPKLPPRLMSSPGQEIAAACYSIK